MDKTTTAGSPLRQRMIEDMRMRKLEPKTQEAYIRAVRKLTVFLERSPDTASVEDLRNFQLHLVDTGTSPITLKATLTALKFFFDITLGRGELMARMQPVKLPRTVPVVLSMQEAAALIAAARNIKHQAALSVAYCAGLRASEVCRLKVGDVDSQRMALRVEQGKGAKDRYAMLSPVVLQRLRAWWRIGHAHITVGGPHASALPREMLEHCPAIDTIVIGEGEETFKEIVLNLENKQTVRYIIGTAWRTPRGVRVAPAPTQIEELDTLAPPCTFYSHYIVLTSRAALTTGLSAHHPFSGKEPSGFIQQATCLLCWNSS